MSKKQIDLSRRKLIAGLGTAGVAAAGAGLGTTAYLNDEESFTGNEITAGTLDMTVSAEIVAQNGEYPEGEGPPLGELYTADGEVTNSDDEEIVAPFQFNDVKPGDWWIIEYEISVADNPGYVTVHAGNYSHDGGANPEPESTPDDGGDGELADKLLVTHWTNFADNESGRSDLSKLDPTTNRESGDPVDEAWGDPDVDGNATLGGNTAVEYTDLLEFLFGADQDPANPDSSQGAAHPLGNGYASTDGVVIRGENPDTNVDDSGGIGGGGGPLQPIGSGGDTQTFYQLIELPEQVGNVIQGDTVSWDLGFVAEQSRNNDEAPRDYPFGNQTTNQTNS